MPEYQIWRKMIDRCTNTASSAWHHYGGRGITVCERWMDFVNFYADMGMRPSKTHTLDRIDNDGNYEPDNCRWATWQEQANNRRSNVFVTVDGESLTHSQAARKIGLTRGAIYLRVRRGVTAPDAPRMSVTEGAALGRRIARERRAAQSGEQP